MAQASSGQSYLSSLLSRGPAPNQRISFSVRVKNAALPQGTDHHCLPWVHVDLLAAGPLTEAFDYRLRPYSVSASSQWRFKSQLWLEADLDETAATTELVDTFEDVYFPVDIPAVACIDLLGCLYAVDSITAGSAPVAQHVLVSHQADDDNSGDSDHLHKKVSGFTQWEPIWRLKVSSNCSLKFESLTSNSDSRFSRTTLFPPQPSSCTKPINVLRFAISSARKFVPKLPIQNGSVDLAQDLSLKTRRPPEATPEASPAKRGRLSVRTASADNADHAPSLSPIAYRTRKGHKEPRVIRPKASSEPRRPSFPLDRLPPELIAHIVCSVSGGPFEQLRCLVVLSGINRRLRRICSDPDLYNVIDLKKLHCDAQRLSPQFIQFLAAKKARTLRLSWLPTLEPASKVGRLVQHGNMRAFISQACPLVDDEALRSLCRANTESLDTLDLSSCFAISRRGFGCLDLLGRLRRLSLSHTSISQKTLELLLVGLGSSLQVLNLSSLHDIGNMDAVCATLAQHVPDLRALDLSDSPSLSPAGLAQLSKGCHVLEELVLLHCPIFTTLACTELAPRHWPELRRLVVHVSDVHALESLAAEGRQHCLSNLEQLAVICLRRPGAPVSALAQLLAVFPRLRYLKVPIEWPPAQEFEESRLQLANLRRQYSQCAIQTHN